MHNQDVPLTSSGARTEIPQLLTMVQKEVFCKRRETLFEYAVCCFSKKKGSLSPKILLLNQMIKSWEVSGSREDILD